MIDRKKVIKGLEYCKLYNKVNCDKCPYDYNGRGEGKSECTAELAYDAIALLEEQKPMKVKMDIYGNAYCPWCSTDKTIEMGVHRLHLGTQFCPYCGKAVKWE